MFKVKYLLFAVLCVLGGYLAGGIVRADHIPLANSNFEIGNMSGWTPYTTAAGTIGGAGYPSVIDFDIDGDGPRPMSKTLQFNAGKNSSNDAGYQGGGIYQTVHLVAGDYVLSVDVAANESGTQFGARDGGRFELLVDGAVVDSHEFTGQIGPNETQHKLLAGIHVVSDGDHEVGIRITRSSPVAKSVSQYVDNFVLALSSPTAAPDPEPASEPAPTDDGTNDGCSNRGNHGDKSKNDEKSGNNRDNNGGNGK